MYLRVSTNGQAEEGLGLDVQEEAVRAWAESSGHEVMGVAVDAAISGAAIAAAIGLRHVFLQGALRHRL
jgi:DNA invertase Pin-like site-specific DNA recombinase